MVLLPHPGKKPASDTIGQFRYNLIFEIRKKCSFHVDTNNVIAKSLFSVPWIINGTHEQKFILDSLFGILVLETSRKSPTWGVPFLFQIGWGDHRMQVRGHPVLNNVYHPFGSNEFCPLFRRGPLTKFSQFSPFQFHQMILFGSYGTIHRHHKRQPSNSWPIQLLRIATQSYIFIGT